jgi:flagellar basal-body rod protein FlgG
VITGLYSAATSMDALVRQQDAIAGNLANQGVSGHKGETVVFRSFPDLLFSQASAFVPDSTQANHTVGRIGTGVGIDWSYMNFQPGPMEETGVPSDLAIDGDGFFAVQTPNGERYTRNSKFQIHLDPQGTKAFLTTTEGYPLLGDRGPVELPSNEKFHVDMFGNVSAGNRRIDQLRLVTVEDKKVLLPESGALFQLEPQHASQLIEAGDAVVRQGYVEKSNVNSVMELIRMIESFRNYETSAKVITTLDQTLDAAINQVGQPIQ